MALAAAGTAAEPVAGLSLGPVFSDHAVLQSGKSIPVWGWASAGSDVAVRFHGQTARTKAASNGRWTVDIGPFPASGDPAELTVTDGETLTLRDVVVGEVWLCSGQSNMEFMVHKGTLFQVDNWQAEVSAGNHPLIRELRIARSHAPVPAETAGTLGWKSASPATVPHFRAVAYFFARQLNQAVGAPIGIIDCVWGGSPIETWMSDAARHSTSASEAIDARWNKAKGELPPQAPVAAGSSLPPGSLYNAMIAPLEPAAIRGILWYQGEANVGRPGEYAELFPALIRSWREGFRQGDLPFYFVQLPNYGDDKDPTGRLWARFREAQAKALALPDTGMAVTIDIGDAHDIHPPHKQEVGRRLALIAESNLYGFPADASGPAYASASTEGDSMVVRFAHAGKGLVAHGGPVRSLEIAGADRVFHAATATLGADSIAVSSPMVRNPQSVRYAWSNSPDANLYGVNGLPALPFRTDDW